MGIDFIAASMAKKKAKQMFDTVNSGVRSHTVSGNKLIFEFEDGTSATMTFNEPVSPSVSTRNVDDGVEVTITDASGPKTFTINHGADGADGADGEDGSIVGDYIPSELDADASWWSERQNYSGGQKFAKKPDGSNYGYMESSEGYYTSSYTNCDIFNVGILADGDTNNANAIPYNQYEHGNFQLLDGMFVAVAGGKSGNNRWHSYDNNTGGHVFEGWSHDGRHRATMLLNEPKRTDGMKEIALFCWDRAMRDFGWTRIGCDGMYTRNSDGSYTIRDTDKEGLSVTRTFAISHTPMMFEPMAKPVYMPEFVPDGLQTDSTRTPVGTGTVYFDESDNKLKIKIGNKWFRFVLEEDSTTSEPETPTTVDVTGVTLNKSTSTVTAGDTETLSATIAPSNATNKTITWSTSDATVATVQNGFVTTLKEGTVTITATSNNGKTASCVFTVNAQSSGGDEEPDEPSGDGLVLSASVTGLSQDYTITDGYSKYAVFKWGDDDYVITSDHAVGYAGGQFRTRAGANTNVYNNGTLSKSTTTSDSQQPIAWGISDNTIKCNHNLVSYMATVADDESSIEATFVKNL